MAQLTGKTEEKITEELVGVIFKNPLTDQWEVEMNICPEMSEIN